MLTKYSDLHLFKIIAINPQSNTYKFKKLNKRFLSSCEKNSNWQPCFSPPNQYIFKLGKPLCDLTTQKEGTSRSPLSYLACGAKKLTARRSFKNQFKG